MRATDHVQATLAVGHALEAFLSAKNTWDKEAAKRELDRREAELRRMGSVQQKVVGGLHHAPLSMSAQEFTR